MRRPTEEEWPDHEWEPLMESIDWWLGMVAGALLSWPLWLGGYLLWRWLTS